jgi:hypothetical protein
MALRFDKPSRFACKAGQYIDLTLSGIQFARSNGANRE